MVRAPIKPSGSKWPQRVREHRLIPWQQDPRVVLEDDPDPVAYSAAMVTFHLGGTVKITARGRHRDPDAKLRELVGFTGATILDIGASDGGTSVDLIELLGESFARYFITDRHLSVDVVEIKQCALFFDRADQCILIAGRGYVAYPGGNPIVARLFRPMIDKARRSSNRRSIQLLHPAVRRLVAEDDRVTVCEHDVFQPWEGPTPDVVKVANLLNRDYFSDDQLMDALRHLMHTVADGGHLFIIDSPADPLDTTARTGLYRRTGESLVAVTTGFRPPAVADLVQRLG